MRLVLRDRQTGYWGKELWLPKSRIPVAALRNGLTFEPDGSDVVVCAWRETPDHLIVPREMYTPEKLSEFGFPVYDTRIQEYERLDFEDRFHPRDEVQEEAWRHLSAAGSGVLNLACGRGKSGLALKKAAQLGGPVLVVVNNTGTMNQWIEEVEKFLNVPKEDVGIIKGPKFDWEKPVAVATIQTLSKRAATWPAEFLNRWKLIIFDEVHHTSARVFSRTLPMFRGERLGLTATLRREDGLEVIFLYHVGPVIFSELEQELQAKIYFQQTPFTVGMNDPRIQDVRGEFSIGKFYRFLGEVEARNEFIATHVRQALANGRKILGLTHSRGHTETLRDLVEGSEVIHGGVKHDRRIEILRENRAVFATPGCAEEAMNDTALDTIMFFTPYQVWRTFQQGVGRAQRRHPGKKDPVVVLFEDSKMPPSRGLFRKLRTNLRSNNWKFTTIPTGS